MALTTYHSVQLQFLQIFEAHYRSLRHSLRLDQTNTILFCFFHAKWNVPKRKQRYIMHYSLSQIITKYPKF